MKSRLFELVDIFWSTLLLSVCYILGWSILPTIVSLPEGSTIKTPFIKYFFIYYSNNPALYLVVILFLGFVISFSLYELLKYRFRGKYSNIYNKKKIQSKFAEFGKDARELCIFGGDLGFLNDSSEQLNTVKKLRGKCKILCAEAQDEKTLALYKTIVDSKADLRRYNNSNNFFADLRGQIKKDSNGNKSCLVVNRFRLEKESIYEVLNFSNQYLIDLFGKTFSDVYSMANNPLIKLICFDLGGVFFDGDFYKCFLDRINSTLRVKISVNHDQKLLLDNDLNLGSIDITQWVEKKTGKTFNQAERRFIINTWKKVWKPNPEMKSLVNNLKSLGYYVGICSNLDKINGDMYKDKGYFSLFPPEFHFLSYEMGITKPDKAFFQEMIKKTKLKPYQILLIDDHEKNIFAAKECDILTLHFSNSDSVVDLKRELQKRRIMT